MKIVESWKFIFENIKADKKVVLLVVAESSNSSPGRQGFKMVVNEDSDMIGTIGGGIMERGMTEYALDLLLEKKSKKIKRLQHTDKTKFENSTI